MKNIILVLTFLSFIKCSEKPSEEIKNDKSIVQESLTNNDSILAILYDTVTSLPQIRFIQPTVDELELFDDLISLETVNPKPLSESVFFTYFTRTFLDEILNFENIRGGSYYFDSNDLGIHIYDFYYDVNSAESNFEHLNNVINETTTLYLNDFHDFFKRGLIIILNKQYSKISFLEFNIFVDPKEVDAIVNYFESNKSRFDGMVIILGNVNHATVY